MPASSGEGHWRAEGVWSATYLNSSVDGELEGYRTNKLCTKDRKYLIDTLAALSPAVSVESQVEFFTGLEQAICFYIGYSTFQGVDKPSKARESLRILSETLIKIGRCPLEGSKHRKAKMQRLVQKAELIIDALGPKSRRLISYNSGRCSPKIGDWTYLLWQLYYHPPSLFPGSAEEQSILGMLEATQRAFQVARSSSQFPRAGRLLEYPRLMFACDVLRCYDKYASRAAVKTEQGGFQVILEILFSLDEIPDFLGNRKTVHSLASNAINQRALLPHLS